MKKNPTAQKHKFIVNGTLISDEFIRMTWPSFPRDPYPIDRRMKVLDEIDKTKIPHLHGKHFGMSTENIRFTVNELVRSYVADGIYLEVGIYAGCSLLSAALFNPEKVCVGIDNFSSFAESQDHGRERLEAAFELFGKPSNITYHICDYSQNLEQIIKNRKVDVYYYDGNHTYEQELNGLRIIKSYLAPKALILIDDVAWPDVNRAIHDFLAESPEFKIEFFVETDQVNDPLWWNGFCVLSKGW